MKPIFRRATAWLVTMLLAGSASAAGLTLGVTTSDSTATFSGSMPLSGVAAGTYTANLNVTDASGRSVASGSNSFTIGAAAGSMTLTTVDGQAYRDGMQVTNTAPQVCGTYSNRNDVTLGYIAVMDAAGTTPRRYQIIPSASTAGAFCANIVLDPGSNVVWAAYVSASGRLIYSTNRLTLNNASTSVSTGAFRVQLTWDKANDMDLHLVRPRASGGTAVIGDLFNSSYDIYYGNMRVTWTNASGQLDIDSGPDGRGYGPENITLNTFPYPGRYLIVVHAYGDYGKGATANSVTVFNGAGQTLTTVSQTLTNDQRYQVGYVNVAANGTYTLEPLGTFAADGSANVLQAPTPNRPAK